MENVGIFLAIWCSLRTFWYILRLFGIFCGHLVYFAVIWYTYFALIWYTYFAVIWYIPILRSFGIFCGHLVYFAVIWYTYFAVIRYILWSFGIFFPVLVCCTMKNLATLGRPRFIDSFAPGDREAL
jgi:hypothetical protein